MRTYKEILESLSISTAKYIAPEIRPFLQPLIEKFAWELGSQYAELENAHELAFESLMEQLFPEVHGRAIPHHAIMEAQPDGQPYQLSNEDAFVSDDGLSFVPLLSLPLHPAGIRYRVHNLGFHVLGGHQRKKEPMELPLPQYQKKEIWLGIDLGEGNDELETPRFYFHNLSLPAEGLLSLIQWQNDGKLLAKASSPSLGDDYFYPFPDADFLRLQRLRMQIIEMYSGRFIQLQGKLRAGTGTLPPEIRAKLKDVEGYGENRISWLKLSFPENFPAEELAVIDIRLNCFPVWNVRIDRNLDQMAQQLMVIPLNSQRELGADTSHFLGMHRVWSDSISAFKPVAFSAFSDIPEGAYALQCSELSTFNGKEAHRRLQALLFLLQEERQAFGMFEREQLQFTLEALEEQLLHLEALLQPHTRGQVIMPNYYLHIKPAQPGEMVYIEYLSCQPEKLLQSGLQPGTQLHGPAGVFRPGGIQLISAPAGGRPPLNTVERATAIKHYLSLKSFPHERYQ
ncbi:MAG: hypothetical protein KDD02_15050 [Phaeodactylibacter sp.]|nr:hypothetical protein [Phaeodactylibacter sp.]MCB9302590.1 hypothetical protein [Lewinellaceae bacterium]